ncbi:MAG: ComEC/Rec2 family competence protein [Marinirhabdus sp.]
MNFVNYAVVKFSICTVLGICAGHFFNFATTPLFIVCGSCFLGLAAMYVINARRYLPLPLFGVFTFGCLTVLSLLNVELREPENNERHYVHYLNERGADKPPGLLQLKITEIVKPGRYNKKYMAALSAIGGKQYSGKVLLYIAKDSSQNEFHINDQLLVYGTLNKIPGPLNPDQFHFKKYMQLLGVHGEVKVSKKDVLLTSGGNGSLRGLAESSREHIIEKLRESPIGPEQRAITQALVLGEKRDIAKSLMEAYAAAGAVHILAVSGLHVGVLYLLLGTLLMPLKRLSRSPLPSNILIVALLWGFALLTGLSPSVTRAVTMFSFFAFADTLGRPTKGINTMFLSFFVLLFINPKWLFHVGFQLSYLAVFFILWVQPKLFGYWYPKHYVVRKLWAIVTVTIAAQLGIVPLSLYYFHQFPGLFLLTNIVVLPFLGVILGFGILVVVLVLGGVLPNWLAGVYNTLVGGLNTFIGWVAGQGTFLFRDITFSIWNMFAGYAVIFAVVLFWKKQRFKTLAFVLVSLLLFVGSFMSHRFTNAGDELVVFNKSRNTLIGLKQNTALTVFTTDTLLTKTDNAYPIKKYRIANGINNVHHRPLPSVFKFKGKRFLILDSFGAYPNTAGIDVVILVQSPKVNLARVMDSLHPVQIVADASNYKTYVKRWKETCAERKTPFHYTGEKGAFIVE